MRTFLEPSRRSLMAAEQRALRMRIASTRVWNVRLRRRLVVAAAAVTISLWVATLFASDSHWAVVTVVWLVLGTGLGFWSLRTDGTAGLRSVDELMSALRRNEADVYEVRARAFADVEEFDDEGALYLFELDHGQLLTISGDEFYEGPRFPCLEFALIYALTEVGTPAWMFLKTRGAKAAASLRLPATFRQISDAPEHLEVRPGTLEQMGSGLITDPK